MNLKECVKPITYLKNNAAEVVREASENGRLMVVTQNGEAKAIVMGVTQYDEWKRTLALLKGAPPAKRVSIKDNLRILWPNSWRTGVQFMSGYLTVNANVAICVHTFGLDANAKYGLSVQLMSIVLGLATVWMSTKWPMIGQHQARREQIPVQRILWPRIWLQTFTFLFLAAGVVFCAPFLLRWLGSNKEMLPLSWLLVLMLGTFLDLQLNACTTLISMENRLPFLWPMVATNVLSLSLTLTLVHFTSLGLGALVLGPLLAGSLFNYWYWPFHAAHRMGTTLLRFLFLGPTGAPKQHASN